MGDQRKDTYNTKDEQKKNTRNDHHEFRKNMEDMKVKKKKTNKRFKSRNDYFPILKKLRLNETLKLEDKWLTSERRIPDDDPGKSLVKGRKIVPKLPEMRKKHVF